MDAVVHVNDTLGVFVFFRILCLVLLRAGRQANYFGGYDLMIGIWFLLHGDLADCRYMCMKRSEIGDIDGRFMFVIYYTISFDVGYVRVMGYVPCFRGISI